MASYFRNLFGGGSSSHSGTSSSKSHSRSKSASNIYATPSGAPSASVRSSSKRSGSYTASQTTTPSPLRYSTETDTRTRYGYGRSRKGSSSSHDPELRPQVLRRATGIFLQSISLENVYSFPSVHSASPPYLLAHDRPIHSFQFSVELEGLYVYDELVAVRRIAVRPWPLRTHTFLPWRYPTSSYLKQQLADTNRQRGQRRFVM